MNNITPVTLRTLQNMKQQGEKIAMLTAYDASFAALLERAGMDVILVGDTLGQMIQGKSSTLPVTVDDCVYHCAAVKRGVQRPLVIADMPFMSYPSVETALYNAGRLLKETEVQMVKLECSAAQENIVQAMADQGIPVCAHLGLRPQSVHKLGGYRVQGRDDASAQEMLRQAEALQLAGADMLLLEAVPADLARQVTLQSQVPVIGIGAGVDCDGQVLVLYDMLGITPGQPPKFVKNFMHGADSVESAVRRYVQEVKAATFPATEHSYS
jgi:3-methyl-2-oxobutanoate hydroxymethyltransferase